MPSAGPVASAAPRSRVGTRGQRVFPLVDDERGMNPMHQRAARRQAGWTIVEVAVASSIGVLVLGASVALTATASDGSATLSRQAAVRRSGKSFLEEFRDQLAQSSVKNISLYALGDGTSAVTYQTVVDHVAGAPVWGADLDRVGTPIDVQKTVFEGRTSGIAALPMDGILSDWKTEFRVLPLEDGTKALVKLYISTSGDVVYADLLTRGVKEFDVQVVGETLEVHVRLGCSDDADRDADSFDETFTIVPRN